jgi:GDP-L-fucose synthase
MNIDYIPDFINKNTNKKILINKFEIIIDNNDKFTIQLLYLEKDLIYIKAKRVDANIGWDCDLKIKLYSIDKTIFEILSIGKSLYNEKIIEIYLNNKFEINFYNNINQILDIPQRIIQVRDEKFNSLNDYIKFHQFIYQNNYFSYLNINLYKRRQFILDNYIDYIDLYDKIKDTYFKKNIFILLYLNLYGGHYISENLIDIFLLDINNITNSVYIKDDNFYLISTTKHFLNENDLFEDLKNEKNIKFEKYFQNFNILKLDKNLDKNIIIQKDFFNQIFIFKNFKMLLKFEGNKEYEIESLDMNYYILKEKNNNIDDNIIFKLINLENHEEKIIKIENFKLSSNSIKIFKLEDYPSVENIQHLLYNHYNIENYNISENIDKEHFIKIIEKDNFIENINNNIIYMNNEIISEVIPKEESTILENLEEIKVIPKEESTILENLEEIKVIPIEDAIILENLEEIKVIPKEESTILENLEEIKVISIEDVTILENLEEIKVIPKEDVTILENLEEKKVIPKEDVTILENLEEIKVIPKEEAIILENMEEIKVIPKEDVTILENLEEIKVIPKEESTILENLEEIKVIINNKNNINIKKKLLITGGNGLVGSALKKVINYDLYETKFLSSKECNLSNYEATYELFKNFKPNYVIHLAASVGGLFKNMNFKVDMLEDNLLINFNVLKCSHLFKVEKLINCLSTCIFPDKTTYPINENMLHDGPPHTSNDAYAYAKRLLEIHSKAYQEQYNDNFVCVIPTNIYGDHDNYSLEDGHVIPSLIHKCYLSKQNGEDFVVRGTGKPLRQFIHSLDLGRLLLWTLEEYKEKNSIILSVDPEEEISIRKIGRLIAKNFDYEARLVFDDSYSDGQYKKTADNSLLKSYLPDYKFINMEDGLKNTIKWFIENYENVRK